MGAVQKKTRFSEIAFEVKYEDIGLEEAEGPPNDVVRGHPPHDRVTRVQAVFVGSIDVVRPLWNDTGWPGLKRLAGSRDRFGNSSSVPPQSPERTRIVRSED